jgi:hypothetical protein
MHNEEAIIFINETKIEEKNTRNWKKTQFCKQSLTKSHKNEKKSTN